MAQAERKIETNVERFQPGVVDVQGFGPVLLDRTGKVYRLVRSARVHDQDVVDRAKEAARVAGRSSSRIIRGSSGIIAPGT